VAEYLNGGNWTVVKEFVEIESGTRGDRPKLAEAIKAYRVYGAKLVIANWIGSAATLTSCSGSKRPVLASLRPICRSLTGSRSASRFRGAAIGHGLTSRG
jgi:hypothetical protein